jgi:hypothetical protein
MITNVSDFIAKIGGRLKASEYFGVTVTAVYNWEDRGLPLWTHQRVRAIAQENSFVLAPGLLVSVKPERKAKDDKPAKPSRTAIKRRTKNHHAA